MTGQLFSPPPAETSIDRARRRLASLDGPAQVVPSTREQVDRIEAWIRRNEAPTSAPAASFDYGFRGRAPWKGRRDAE